MYDPAALQSALHETIYAGKLHYAASTASTNTDAMAAARAGAPHGSVYFADEQTAGRGRGGHRWESARNAGLYVSALLRVPLAAARLPLLPLAAGIAAADAIQAVTGVLIDLRWPNDLLVEDRKVGGILVESKIEGSTLAFAVVGIGINVHQRSFDPELATPATSLDLASGRTVSRQELLVALLKSVEHETHLLADDAAAQTVPGRVAERSTWMTGRAVTVHGPQACTGTTVGLDDQGFLLVQTANGLITVQTGGIRTLEMD